MYVKNGTLKRVKKFLRKFTYKHRISAEFGKSIVFLHLPVFLKNSQVLVSQTYPTEITAISMCTFFALHNNAFKFLSSENLSDRSGSITKGQTKISPVSFSCKTNCRFSPFSSHKRTILSGYDSSGMRVKPS